MKSILCSLVLLVFLGPGSTAAHGEAPEEVRCGPKLKKKEVTIYEVGDFRTATWALRLVAEEHGQVLEERLTEEVQADRSLPKEARRRAARMGCPHVIVGPAREVVTGIHYETARAGQAALPVETTVFRGWVVFADEAPTPGGEETP